MKTSTIKMLLALAPLFAIAGCASEDGSEELGPEGCVGGKCDDVTDPEAFACQTVQDLTGLRAAGFVADLDDPMARFILRNGEGCPGNMKEIMAKLEETDSEDCASFGKLSTFTVSETNAFEEGGHMRLVTSRRCGGRQNWELTFSPAGGDANAGFVEAIAFDQTAGVFNYYSGAGGTWRFHGSSADIVTGDADGCDNCHTGGGLIMKEMRNPWYHWDGLKGANEFISANEHLGRRGGGSSMESLTKNGNSKWNDTKVALLTNPESGTTVKDMLHPIFCGDEFNMDSAGEGFVRETDDGFDTPPPELLPDLMFGNCKLFGDSCQGTHLAESSGVNIDADAYRAARTAVGSRKPHVSGANDGHSAMPFLEPALADLDYYEKLAAAGAVDNDFIVDVVAVDMTRPVFSDIRCGLLQWAPEWDDLASEPEEPEEPEEPGDDDDDDDAEDPTDGETDGETDGTMDAGNCCDADAEASRLGCENTEIEACVCERDSFCCPDSEDSGAHWDSLCVTQAVEDCGAACGERNDGVAAAPQVIKEAKIEAIRAGFIANLEAAEPEEGTVEFAFLQSLKNTEDTESHRARARALIDTCQARHDDDPQGFIEDMFHIVAWQRAIAQPKPVMESDSLMPEYTEVSITKDTHIDPATCELIK